MTTPNQPASTRRIGATAKLLAGHPDDVIRVLDRLDEADLANLGEAVNQIQRRRAVERGDLDALVAEGFDQGFGTDGIALLPWVAGGVIVCPGGIVAKSKASHRCRFVSVNDVWIWDSPELIREDKRSNPGRDTGFKAVGLLPLVSGLAFDVVSGRARGGQHSVDQVVSYEVKGQSLVEVSQRQPKARGQH